MRKGKKKNLLTIQDKKEVSEQTKLSEPKKILRQDQLSTFQSFLISDVKQNPPEIPDFNLQTLLIQVMFF